MSRCDAIAVTGEGTGKTTPMEKIRQFRNIMGDFPLVVGAGMTPDTCAEQFSVADAAIVGSYFKQGYLDDGYVEPRMYASLCVRWNSAAEFCFRFCK